MRRWAKSSDYQSTKHPIFNRMPDTRVFEGGKIWPRRYTIAELETIAKAAGVEKCGPIAKEKLQRAVEDYQRATTVDPGGLFFRSNKERRDQVIRILKLRAWNAPAEKIDEELESVDAKTSKLLGPALSRDLKTHKRAARRALKILSRPRRGPNPKLARLQFVAELICIFEYATRRRAGRSVDFDDGQERGELRAFVVAALKPFEEEQGCEADIRGALRHKTRLRQKTSVG
jgi:hypothetical protein